MEAMHITVLTVRDLGSEIRAYVRAEAPAARIMLRLTFPRPPDASRGELWQRARDEALRYLDIA